MQTIVLFGCQIAITDVFDKGSGKGSGTFYKYNAAYMNRLKTSSALQSLKWQLIGMS